MSSSNSEVDSPFALDLPIKPDESLNGYFQRSAWAYGLPNAMSFLVAAGGICNSLADFHNAGIGEERVARACRLQIADIRKRRFFRKTSTEPVEVSGTKIDIAFIRGRRLRIAPVTFSEIGYHKFEWDLDFLQFDLKTGERLIDCCPSCKTALSWSRSNFKICDVCGSSLIGSKDTPTSIEARLVASTFADLLSPDPNRVAVARARFAPEIQPISTENIYKFLFEMSGLFEERKRVQPRTKQRPVPIEWESMLKRAFQIATEWPEAMLDLLDTLRRDSGKRGGRFGLKKEFGDLAVLLREWDSIAEIHAVVFPVIRRYLNDHPEIKRKARTEFANEIDDTTRYVPLQVIREKYSWGHDKASRLIKIPGIVVGGASGSGAPMQIDCKKVAEIYNDLQSMITRRAIRNIWGFSHDAVAEICDAGLFEEVTEPHVALVGNADRLYRRHQVAGIIDRVSACVQPVKTPHFTTNLNNVVFRLKGIVPNPWARTVAAVLNGELKPILKSRKQIGGFGQIEFDMDEIASWIGNQRGEDEARYTIPIAAKRLGYSPQIFRLMVANRHIRTLPPRPGEKGQWISEKEIQRAKIEYSSCGELCRRFKRVPFHVTGSLAAAGIKPLEGMPIERAVYRSKDIPAKLRMLSLGELSDQNKLSDRNIRTSIWRKDFFKGIS